MRPWSVKECEAYAKQLRDKKRANTAEHAAQAIEYLLEMVKRERLAQPEQEPRQWQGLTDEDVKSIWRDIDGSEGLLMRFARAIEEKLKERNT